MICRACAVFLIIAVRIESRLIMAKSELEPYEKLILSVKRKLEKKKDG